MLPATSKGASSSGAVAQVDHEARAEIGDIHNRVLSGFEHLSRRISRSETGPRIAAGTYATAPSRNDTLPAVPSLLPLPHGSSDAAEANPRQPSHSGSEERRQRRKQLGRWTRPPFRGRLGVRLQHLRDGAAARSL